MRTLTALFAVLVVITASAAESTGVARLVAELPGKPPEQWHAIVDRLAGTGANGAREIVDMLKEPGRGDDTGARTALHALAVYAGSPGHEEYRKSFVGVIAEGVSSRVTRRPDWVRAFLVEQFVFAGRPEDTFPPEITDLLDDRLGGPICRAMTSVRTKDCVRALADAIYAAKDQAPLRPTVLDAVQAAGDLGEGAGGAGAGHEDREYRLVETRSWAQTSEGDPDDLNGIGLADAIKDPYERAQAVDALLLLARRLVGMQKLPEAERIYLHLLDTFKDAPSIQCAGLQGLAQAAPQGALPMLLAATEGDRRDIRAAALKAGQSLPGRAVTRAWLKQVGKVSPEAGAEILAMLARRGDPDVLNGVMALTKAPNTTLRHAAIAALPSLGAEDVVGPLVSCLADPADAGVAREALARLPGRATIAIIESMQDAKPSVKIALLSVLVARQTTVYQDYVLFALRDSDLEVRRAALDALGRIGDHRVLPAVIEAFTKASDARERTAAEKAARLIALTEPDSQKRAAALGRLKTPP